MIFSEELKRVRENKLEDYALEFAENIKPELILGASKGYNSLTLELKNRDDKNILIDSEFHGNLEMLLEGCKVVLETKEFTNPFLKNKYKERYLLISWE